MTILTNKKLKIMFKIDLLTFLITKLLYLNQRKAIRYVRTDGLPNYRNLRFKKMKITNIVLAGICVHEP